MYKLVNKYEAYKPHEGTYNVGESLTDKSQAEDAEIYKCIEKYGITSLIRESQAKEPLYLDNTGTMTLTEAVNFRKEMDNYFASMPARARKLFGDNPEIFYQKYQTGEFDTLFQAGALTKEQAELIKEQRNEQRLQENNYSDNTANSTDNTVDNSTMGNA